MCLLEFNELSLELILLEYYHRFLVYSGRQQHPDHYFKWRFHMHNFHTILFIFHRPSINISAFQMQGLAAQSKNLPLLK